MHCGESCVFSLSPTATASTVPPRRKIKVISWIVFMYRVTSAWLHDPAGCALTEVASNDNANAARETRRLALSDRMDASQRAALRACTSLPAFLLISSFNKERRRRSYSQPS